MKQISLQVAFLPFCPIKIRNSIKIRSQDTNSIPITLRSGPSMSDLIRIYKCIFKLTHRYISRKYCTYLRVFSLLEHQFTGSSRLLKFWNISTWPDCLLRVAMPYSIHLFRQPFLTLSVFPILQHFERLLTLLNPSYSARSLNLSRCSSIDRQQRRANVSMGQALRFLIHGIQPYLSSCLFTLLH